MSDPQFFTEAEQQATEPTEQEERLLVRVKKLETQLLAHIVKLEAQLAKAKAQLKIDTNPRTRHGRTIIRTTKLDPNYGRGFYWHCLDCKAMNEAETSPMDVTCTGCHRKYRLEPVEVRPGEEE